MSVCVTIFLGETPFLLVLLFTLYIFLEAKMDYQALFEDLGAFIKAIDEIHDTATGNNAPVPHLPNLLSNINSVLNSNSTDHILDGVNTTFTGISDSMSGYASVLSEKCDERLLDRETVLNQLLSANSASVDEVLYELIRAMVRDNETVGSSTVTLGVPSADVSNTGNGTVYTTKILDGVSAPGSSFAPHPKYKGVNSQLAVPSETVTITCETDSDSGGVPDGEERFLIEGQLAWDGAFDWKSEGSGESVTISTDNATTIVANKDWEAWNSDGTPVSWTVTTGTSGTDYAPDYTDANVFRGNASLKKIGTGGNILFEQTVFNNFLTPNRQYRMSLAWKASSVSAGTLKFELYSPSNPSMFSSETLTKTFSGSETTNYAILTNLIMLPSSLPDDLVWRLSTTSIDGDLWIDAITFAPVNYVGGIGYNIIAGSTSFIEGDRFSVTQTNSEGLFQRFFRRKYGVQLPSLAPTANTIKDSWAT